MFSTSRIRTVLAVLVAAACVAVAVGSVIPDARARPNDGRYKKSQDAKRQQRLCDVLHSTLHDQGVIFDQAIADTNMATAGRVLDDMYATFDAAKKAGCSWAARVVLPAPPLPQQTAPPPVRTATGCKTAPRSGEGIEPSNPGAARACRF